MSAPWLATQTSPLTERRVLSASSLRTQTNICTTLRGISKSNLTTTPSHLASVTKHGPLPLRCSKSASDPLLRKLLRRSLTDEMVRLDDRLPPDCETIATGGISAYDSSAADRGLEDALEERELCNAFGRARAATL